MWKRLTEPETIFTIVFLVGVLGLTLLISLEGGFR